MAVGLLVAAFWLVRSAGGAGDVVAPRTVEPWVSDAASEAPTGASPSASTLPPADTGTPSGEVAGAGGDQIVVDVGGKVRRPGIAVLPVGARVVDAVRSAGGVRKGVRLTSVNMARLLTDGEQVLIGIQPVAGSAAGAAPTTPVPGAPTSALVNLNTADQAALETLPGVGPVTAAAILQWRTEHGGFTSVDELLEVSGIGEVTLAEIAPHVTL